MRYHWLKEHQNKNFKVYWEPGKNKHADYFTKHHSPVYDKKVCTKCILKGFNIMLNGMKKRILETGPKLACEGVLLPPYLDSSTTEQTSMGTEAQSQNDR